MPTPPQSPLPIKTQPLDAAAVPRLHVNFAGATPEETQRQLATAAKQTNDAVDGVLTFINSAFEPAPPEKLTTPTRDPKAPLQVSAQVTRPKNKDLRTRGSLRVGEDLTIGRDLSVEGDVEVGGTTVLHGDLIVEGTFTLLTPLADAAGSSATPLRAGTVQSFMSMPSYLRQFAYRHATGTTWETEDIYWQRVSPNLSDLPNLRPYGYVGYFSNQGQMSNVGVGLGVNTVGSTDPTAEPTPPALFVASSQNVHVANTLHVANELHVGLGTFGTTGTFTGAVTASSVTSGVGFRSVVGPFTLAVAAGGAGTTQLTFSPSTVFPAGVLNWVAPFPGSIVGISGLGDMAGVVQNVTLEARINGGVPILAQMINSATPQWVNTTSKGAHTFTAGTRLSMWVTYTSAAGNKHFSGFLCVEMAA